MSKSTGLVLFQILLISFCSCSFSESERKAAENKLIDDGVLKSESVLKKEEKFKSLIVGKWILIQVNFLKSKKTDYYKNTYKNSKDCVSISNYRDSGTKEEVSIDNYTVKNSPDSKHTSKYFYSISDDLLSENLLKKDNPSGTTYEYKILTLTKDSLILQYLGSSLNYSSEVNEVDDPYIEYYVRSK